MSDPDRFILFKNLCNLFGMVNPRYKVISYQGVDLDLLDLLVSPLYLAGIQAENKAINEVKPSHIQPVKKKISQFTKHLSVYLRDSLQSSFQNRNRNKLAQSNNTQNTKVDIVFWPTESTHLDQQIPVAKILAEKAVPLPAPPAKVIVPTNLFGEP